MSIDTSTRSYDMSAFDPERTDADAVDTDVSGPSGSDTTPPGGDAPVTARRWPRRVAAGVLVLVTIASLAFAAVLGWRYQDMRAVESAAEQARATARNYAVTLTSIDKDGLDQNFTDVLDGATGEFKDMYAQSSEQLKQLLLDNQAFAQGTVVADGVKSATETTVEVLLFVDQSVTNSVTPEARMDRSRIVMTMELVDGRWLASKVDLP